MALERLRVGLIKALGGYVTREDAQEEYSSYIDRLPRVDLAEDVNIGGPEVYQYLKTALAPLGLTRGQKIAVSSAIGKTDFSRKDHDKRLTIGDIRKMSDEEIRGLVTEWASGPWHPGPRTVQILRKLFGGGSLNS